MPRHDWPQMTNEKENHVPKQGRGSTLQALPLNTLSSQKEVNFLVKKLEGISTDTTPHQQPVAKT